MNLSDLFHQLEQMEDCFDEEELHLIDEARSSFFAGFSVSYETKTQLEELIEVAYERYG